MASTVLLTPQGLLSFRLMDVIVLAITAGGDWRVGKQSRGRVEPGRRRRAGFSPGTIEWE